MVVAIKQEMVNSYPNSIYTVGYKVIKSFILIVLIAFVQPLAAQESFDKNKIDKAHKKGTNIEYYKNGNIKSVSQYKRKVFWYYTDTYWTIKEYDMEGNQIRLIKKVTQIARRENKEKVIKEEIRTYEPKVQPKESIRPE